MSKVRGKHRALLDKPVREHYADYTSRGGQAAFSTFAKYRPSNVRTMMNTNLRQCLCEYCANVDLKLRALGNVFQMNNCRIRHKFHAMELSMCEGGGKCCAYRTCSECGVSKLGDYLAPVKDHQGLLSWHRWTTKKVTLAGTKKTATAGKEVTRKVLERRGGTIDELLKELLEEVAFLSEHLFRANWQHKQFEALRARQPFPQKTVIMVMDFAENYACQYQDKVQSAHWNHNQVTIHPISSYYACSSCDGVVNESLVFISNDLTHDYHAVQNFVSTTMQHHAAWYHECALAIWES